MADRWRLSAFGDEIAGPLEEQVAALAAAAVGAIEVRSAWGRGVLDLTGADLRHAAAVLGDAGIAVSAIGSPVGKSPIEADHALERDRLLAALRAADALGTPLVRVFSFYVPAGRAAEHRDEVLRRMAALAREAQAAGTVLVHENELGIYGDVPDRCLDLVRTVGSPGLAAAFDPANFVQAGADPMREAWPLLRDHVRHVHVKDAVAVRAAGLEPGVPAPPDRQLGSVRLPGDGDGDLPGLLRALDATGYGGYLTLEPHLATLLPDLSGAERFARAVGALRGLVWDAIRDA